MQFVSVKTLIALVATIGIKCDAASIKNSLQGKGIDRRSSGTSGGCIRNCSTEAVPNKFYYNFCDDCTKFVQCDQNGGTFVMSCPTGLFWNDNRLSCDFDTPTCGNGTTAEPTTTQTPTTTETSSQTSTTPPSSGCITSCDGRPDGDYQSCIGCDVYASCSGGILYDNRPCPANLLWDDNLKRCEYSSATCSP